MAQIPKTQKKLREARFFFARLRKKGEAFVGDPEEFEFYLSAFLTSGCSVTSVLLNEKQCGPWSKKWKDTLTGSDRKLWDFMHKERNAEVHRKGTKIDTEVLFVPIIEVRQDARGHPAYGFHWFAPPGTPPPEVGKQVHYFEMGSTKEEVTETCKRYLELLERLVQEFDQAFPGK